MPITRAKTDKQKREIIERLYTIWTKNPDLRLGQLIDNSVVRKDIFYVEDGQFLDWIEDYYQVPEFKCTCAWPEDYHPLKDKSKCIRKD
jgi:hypothetical protein